MRHTLTLKRLLTLHSFLNEENVEKESFVSEGEEIAQLEEEEREKIEKEFVEERIQVEVPAPGQH